MPVELRMINDGRVMADFVASCSEKDEESFLLFVLAFLRVNAFNGDFCLCNHSIQNLMVSNNIKLLF